MKVNPDNIEESLKILDTKLGQLKLGYEQYFLGSRPREPVPLRSEVDRVFLHFANQPIQNTGLRFKFKGLCSKYQAFKRQWNDTLRKIEAGTYARHRFKADLHERERATAPLRTGLPAGTQNMDHLFDAYRAAKRSCGEDVKSLTPQKLERALAKQRESLRSRYGDDGFSFKVVVQEGRVKLRASRA